MTTFWIWFFRKFGFGSASTTVTPVAVVRLAVRHDTAVLPCRLDVAALPRRSDTAVFPSRGAD